MSQTSHIIFNGLLFCTSYLIARSDPPLGHIWVPIPELTDEFNETLLDSKKWFDHNPDWKGRKPGLFSSQNVSVSEGKLHLLTRFEELSNSPQGYHTYTTSAVKSVAPVKYGYFEAKCRPMKSKASSAFWFYKRTNAEWTEIDVFEMCGAAGKWANNYIMHAHVFHAPGITEKLSNRGEWISPFKLADDFHVYGLEWDELNIRWYVDGIIVFSLRNTHWHQPLQLNFDSEIMQDWFGLPEKESLPSTFSIEYIRAWKKSA